MLERLCKYYGGNPAINADNGPNAGCVQAPIQKLVASPTDIITAIGKMQALGATNIHAGAIWGFRALSPGYPLAQGAPYGKTVQKVMIIMTDGENTTYNLDAYCDTGFLNLMGSCFHGSYGFPYNSLNTNPNSTSGGNIELLGHLGAANSTMVNTMNERTLQTCTNAKAAGITIYTIGLSTEGAVQSTPQTVRNVLTQCASTPDKAHFPDNPSELKDVFASIATDLTKLRLTR